MLLKFLLKIWPALLPITLYIFWIYIVERLILKKLLKKKTIIEGKFEVVGEKSTDTEKITRFSLKNRNFVIIIYASLILAILTLVITAILEPKKNSTNYVPAQLKDGKILPPGTE